MGSEKMTINVVSMSGGKDSTATALVAREQEAENLHYVFADTGHEHQATYDYVDYLEGALGITIHRVKADFAHRVIHKRDVVADKWRRDGVDEAHVLQALEYLQPTGNPFLDLCLWKGRFPSTRRRFCSEELKHRPMDAYHEELMADGGTLVSWQGVRADESASRANLPEKDVNFGAWEPEPFGSLIYRPILKWTAQDTFDIAKRHGIKPNPLYKAGMGRVGCMPCIHATKTETYEIARRFPEELERLARWEVLVSKVAKRGCSTFFDARVVQRSLGLPDIDADNLHKITPATHGVAQFVEWTKTAHGGRQYDLIKAINLDEEAPTCSSQYGLCE